MFYFYFCRTSSCLKEALDSCDPGDIIILGKGNHPIRGSGNLEDGGMIKGINSRETTILCPKETESGPSLLDFSGEEVNISSYNYYIIEFHILCLLIELIKLIFLDCTRKLDCRFRGPPGRHTC